jgi:hypothetical protein
LSTMSVEQSMVLNIHVIYKAPSRELLFLGTGWAAATSGDHIYLKREPRSSSVIGRCRKEYPLG